MTLRAWLVLGALAMSGAACSVRHPSPNGETMPDFPWPPPRPTIAYELPDGLVATSSGDSLSAANRKLIAALNRAGIFERSFYGIDRGRAGFAMVTRIEAIDETGAPLPDARRFPADLYRGDERGFVSWLKAVFRAEPGFYRVIAFLITDRPVVANGPRLTPEAADSLLAGGASSLVLQSDSLRPSLRCIALIYEFERRNFVDPVTQRSLSLATPVRHLSLAGLWPAAALTR